MLRNPLFNKKRLNNVLHSKIEYIQKVDFFPHYCIQISKLIKVYQFF